MSNVEAAASLFGPPDPTSDFFVGIGENESTFDSDASPDPLPTSNDNTVEKSLIHDSSTTDREEQIYDSNNALHPRSNHSHIVHSDDPSSAVFYSSAYDGQATETQGYYDHYGQWHIYEGSDQTQQNLSSSTFEVNQISPAPTFNYQNERSPSQDYEQINSARDLDRYGSHLTYDSYRPSNYAKGDDSNITTLHDTSFSNASHYPSKLETYPTNSYQSSLPEQNSNATSSQYHPSSYNAYDPPISRSKYTRMHTTQKPSSFPVEQYDYRPYVQEQDYRASDSSQSAFQAGYTESGYQANTQYNTYIGGYGAQYDFPHGHNVYSDSHEHVDQVENHYGPEFNPGLQSLSLSDQSTTNDGLGMYDGTNSHSDMSYYSVHDGYQSTPISNYSSESMGLSNGAVRNSIPSSGNLSCNGDSASLERNNEIIGVINSKTSFSSSTTNSPSSKTLSQDSISLAALIPLPISPQEMPRMMLHAPGDNTNYLHPGYQYPSSTPYADVTERQNLPTGTYVNDEVNNLTYADEIPFTASPLSNVSKSSSVFLPAQISSVPHMSDDFIVGVEPKRSTSTNYSEHEYKSFSYDNRESVPSDLPEDSEAVYTFASDNAYADSSMHRLTDAKPTSLHDPSSSVASNVYSPSLRSGTFDYSASTYNSSASPFGSLKSDGFSQSMSIHEPHFATNTESDLHNYVSGRSIHQYPENIDIRETSGSPPASYGAYAPSPSLLGTNDPLERSRIKLPVVSFGFGGKLVTCFHNPPSLETGFDVALSSRKSTDIRIHHLRKLILPDSEDISHDYPGPLLGDHGASSTSLVRTGTNVSAKAKKAKILVYLDHRIDNVSRELGYMPQGSTLRQQTADKLVLIRLLKVMVENDGQLTGSTHIDTAVREVLLGSEGTNTSDFFNPASVGQISSYQKTPMLHHDETPVAVYNVRNTTLDRLQNLLLRGEKRQAYHYALDEKMWAHAMVISSSLDKESFQAAVGEFITAELGLRNDGRPSLLASGSVDHKNLFINGRESLRVAYSLFSGRASASVQELLPQKHTIRTSEPRTTSLNNASPISPEFPSSASLGKIATEVLSRWRETASVVFSGQMGLESSFALTSLGDYLIINDWINAAHCCYLLSPKSSPIGGVSAPSARITLLGFQNPQRMPLFHKDPDFVVLTEIAEFALSLLPPAKGQEQFFGFPHLQAYRLLWAEQLAENGDITLAKRYCEAIAASMTRASPYFCQVLSEKLKDLSDRLTGESTFEKGGSWIGSRITKPNLDSIGDWLGKGLSRFVAGEGDPTSPPLEENITNSNHYSGAFSHFSTISSTDNSIAPSPSSSVLNVNSYTALAPQRPLNSRTAPEVQTRINRAASAMDYRPTLSENSFSLRVSSASATTTSFSQASSYPTPEVYNSKSHDLNDIATNGKVNGSESPSERDMDGNSVSEYKGNNWWDGVGNSNDTTPVATTFYKLDAPTTQSSGIFSLMDDDQYQSTALSPSATNSSITQIPEEDDELGLGNTATKKKVSEDKTQVNAVVEEKEKAAPAKKPEMTTSSSGSWFGRWWGRGSSTPGPIKASLGEETSFYYDKDLKKWINKKTNSESTPTTPLPPTRAQTASPSRNAGRSVIDSPGAGLPPPPVRPASAAEVGALPGKKQEMRKRSNLIPTESDASSFSTSDLATPSRPKSSATKRGIRNRYVVLQQ